MNIVKKVFLFLFFAQCFFHTAFGQLFKNGQGLKDIDQNEYKTILINNEEWMAQNLNVAHFRNGDAIEEVKSNGEWVKAGKEKRPAWCYYNNDPSLASYGKLYNWYAVIDPRGLAPEGWRVPSDEEWTQSSFYFGGDNYTKISNYVSFSDEIFIKNNNKVAKNLKSTSGWKKNQNGTVELGFCALPSGSRSLNGKFLFIGSRTGWWSTTPFGNYDSWVRYINYKKDQLGAFYYNQASGLSVRCIKD